MLNKTLYLVLSKEQWEEGHIVEGLFSSTEKADAYLSATVQAWIEKQVSYASKAEKTRSNEWSFNVADRWLNYPDLRSEMIQEFKDGYYIVPLVPDETFGDELKKRISEAASNAK